MHGLEVGCTVAGEDAPPTRQLPQGPCRIISLVKGRASVVKG